MRDERIEMSIIELYGLTHLYAQFCIIYKMMSYSE